VAIELARGQLGWQAVLVSSTTFSRGIPCPPDARCAAPLRAGGWVLFRFIIGDPVIVYVHRADSGVGFVAEPPEPAPDYLL
jgi:hypothetical protein